MSLINTLTTTPADGASTFPSESRHASLECGSVHERLKGRDFQCGLDSDYSQSVVLSGEVVGMLGRAALIAADLSLGCFRWTEYC